MAAHTHPDPQVLRNQLAECSEYIGGLIADAARISTPERLESLAIQLRGVAGLVMSLRAAQIAEATHDAR